MRTIMKRILSVFIMVVLAIQFGLAKDVVTKDEKRLPEQARSFIKQYFASSYITSIKIESDQWQQKKYEVKFTDGVEIEFDNNGEWKEIDMRSRAVPSGIVPSYVSNYVTSNYNNQYVIQLEKDSRGIEVKLNNGLELKFDNRGNLREIDD
ncbi:MAG: PepSY-like domain-containing protein [Bacteroides sp.]|nr:PepSY-like domain-containing protein [Bacteroides sp.]